MAATKKMTTTYTPAPEPRASVASDKGEACPECDGTGGKPPGEACGACLGTGHARHGGDSAEDAAPPPDAASEAVASVRKALGTLGRGMRLPEAGGALELERIRNTGQKYDAVLVETEAAREALDDIERELAEKTELEDRIRTILDEAVSMMPVMPAQEALTLLEEHVHSLRMAVEIAQRREPTQAEGDAHEWRHDQSMGASHHTGECYVPAGGWTGRRCRVCNRWVWGGPTACVGCAELGNSRHVEQPAETEEQAAMSELREWLAVPGTLRAASISPISVKLQDYRAVREWFVTGSNDDAAIREALRLAKENESG